MTTDGNTYHCTAGETFDSIALKVYKNEKYACEILFANPTLCRIPVFTGGEILQLPDVAIPEEEDEGFISSTKAPWKE